MLPFGSESHCGMSAIPLVQQQSEDAHVHAEIDFEARVDAAGSLQHIYAHRTMIGSLTEMLLMISKQTFKKPPIHPIHPFIPVLNTLQQLLLTLHVIIAIRSVFACLKHGITQELHLMVFMNEKLHRKIQHLILVEPVHHEAALRREKTLQTFLRMFVKRVRHKHPTPRG